MTETTTMPNSRESEMMVLGSMLTSINSLNIAADTLIAFDFYHTEHQTIFNALKSSYDNDKPADVHLVCEELKRQDKLDSVGGPSYVTSLAQFAGTSAFIEEYVEVVKNKAILRRMIHTARETEKSAFAEPNDVQQLLTSSQEKLNLIGHQNNPSKYKFKNLLQSTSENEIAEEIKNTSPGVRVGFKIGEIDLKIPGGALTIIAAPTSHGKTLTKINFILNFLELYPDKQAYFFSYEESKGAILALFMNTYIDRNLSENNRESIKSYFQDGYPQYISDHEKQDFLTKKEQFFKSLIESKRLNIFYSDYTVEELDQAIRFLKENTNVGLIGIDYMQLLSLRKKSASRQEELKAICLILKNCTVDTGLPIMLSAQFNRTVVSEQTLSALAIGEAGDIERVANMVIGLFNRNYDKMSPEGNKGRDGRVISKESAIYIEILKGRGTGIGHSSVLSLNGNSGKLKAKDSTQQTESYKDAKEGNPINELKKNIQPKKNNVKDDDWVTQ